METTNHKRAHSVESAAYSVDEWCARWGMGRNTFYSLVSAGKLKTAKIGRRRIVTKRQDREFAEFLEQEAGA